MPILVGAVFPRVPGARYWSSLGIAELAPRRPLPRPAVLGRWRRAAPEGARLTLLAPTETWKGPAGALREDPGSSEGVRWLMAAADALAADALVLSTGAEITPGPRDRERLARFVGRLARGRRPVVWLAGGLWEPEAAAEAARGFGAVAGFDPLEAQAPPGSLAYARVHAIGAHARLGEGTLARIAETLLAATAETSYVVLDAGEGPRRARRLAEMLASGEIPRPGAIELDAGDDDDVDEADDDEADDDEDEADDEADDDEADDDEADDDR